MPILQSDDRASARNRSAEFTDERLTYFWDARLSVGELWQQVMGLAEVPWDVFMLYGANAQWETAPDMPDFWTRKLGGPMQARVELKLKELLSQIQ